MRLYPNTPSVDETTSDEAVLWLERTLPRIMRRLLDSEDLEMPLLQLPLAQMRLAQALFRERDGNVANSGVNVADIAEGDTMGRLSERLNVRHNALSQAADRLVNHGLAERFSDPNDRRLVRLRLTDRGYDWVEARRARRRAHLSRLWELLDTAERMQFLQAVHTLEATGDRLASDNTNNTEIVIPTVEETLSRLHAESSDMLHIIDSDDAASEATSIPMASCKEPAPSEHTHIRMICGKEED